MIWDNKFWKLRLNHSEMEIHIPRPLISYRIQCWDSSLRQRVTLSKFCCESLQNWTLVNVQRDQVGDVGLNMATWMTFSNRYIKIFYRIEIRLIIPCYKIWPSEFSVPTMNFWKLNYHTTVWKHSQHMETHWENRLWIYNIKYIL